MTKLYEANDHILIHADYANPLMHSHMAAHIIIPLGGEMRLTADGAEYQCHGALIPSGTAHLADTDGKAALVFLFDCTTDVARQIQGISCIAKECCRNIAAAYAAMEQQFSAAEYYRFERFALSQLGFAESSPAVQDERIKAAMNYIRSGAGEQLSRKEVADAVHLSPSRFSHLFGEQVGMTFAAYLIYQRIMRVYTLVLRGKSITEAALAAGFSSSAHFADVNRRVFGLPASSITRDLIFIKLQ